MQARVAVVAVFLVTCLLAGCTGSEKTPDTTDVPLEKPILTAGRGAISGLLIDDIYRPVPGAIILLQGAGLTATTNEQGLFQFLDLLPGAYIAVVSVARHDAAPQNVDIVAGEYTELELVARRVFSEDGQIVTTQFSAFIPCAADFVANGVVANCLLDLSGDSYRAGFTTKNVTGLANITYMVTEAKMNKVGNYNLQVREDDGSSAGGERYAVGRILNSDYLKIVNQFNVTNTEHNVQANNVPWTGEKPFATIIFYEGQYRDEAKGVGQPIEDANVTNPATGNPVRNPICCGVGAEFGIKAQFVQSIFLGDPRTPIEQYQVLGPSA